MSTQPLTTLCESVIAASEAATQGPWTIHAPRDYSNGCTVADTRSWLTEARHSEDRTQIRAQSRAPGGESRQANAAFIALSRTAAPALARAVMKLLPYANHHYGCSYTRFSGCTCGFDTALSGVLDDEGGA